MQSRPRLARLDDYPSSLRVLPDAASLGIANTSDTRAGARLWRTGWVPFLSLL